MKWGAGWKNKGQVDNQSRCENQGRWSARSHTQRKEGCIEQDWESQGRRPGKTTEGKELGKGRGCRAGTVLVGEAHGN